MQLISPLIPPLIEKPQQRLVWGNCQGSVLSLAISNLATQTRHLIVVITTDTVMTNRLETELKFFLDETVDIPVMIFPDRETLPYDMFSPHQDIISERLSTLYRLPSLTRGILLVSLQTLMHYLPPREFIEQNSFVQKKGDRISLETLSKRLTDSGYYRVNQVLEHGEFAVRGSIIDLFPMGSHLPYRIDLFDDEVESIRTFEPESQRTITTVEEIRLLPAREHPITETAISFFRQQWRVNFSGNPALAPVYQAISDGHSYSGIEYYLPLFFEHMQTLFDYLPLNSLLIKVGDINNAAEKFNREIQERFQQRQYDISHPLLAPKKLFLPIDEVFHFFKQFSQIQCQQEKNLTHKLQVNFNCTEPPLLTIQRQSEKPLQLLEDFLLERSQRVLFCAESAGRREALLKLLQTIGVTPKNYTTWQEFIVDQSTTLGITIAPLEQGLCLQEPPIALISEAQIFGLQVLQTRRRVKTKAQDSDAVVKDLLELNIGAPIVHVEHGIGHYLGLQTLHIANIEAEYLTLEYANHDKLYVPVSSLHLINRYTGPDSEHIPLNKLGSEQWSKAKRKAAEKIRDVAAELLAIQAKRAIKSGYAFSFEESEYSKFASTFPFETTLDQEKAINNVLSDMQMPKTMDRLICGDVGFGKTEVAMRAAFLAVTNGKQVAVLVPTTLLAQQHYQTFCDRFADWPVRIEMLSRFRSIQEQNKIIDSLTKKNSYDIIIGTHKLLQKDIHFGNLGLLIIDEEHRFGVQQKEKLKALRAEVDIVTLTATPIPRTLNMAIAGVRDLSIIATPPARRLSIKTFIHEYNVEIIREAILREVLRGGQVYYLHNDVATIDRTAQELLQLIPEIKVAVAHGQLRERDLERVMSDFYHHRFNVLVCSTIIESGIDIPTANTIIIERADKFGLAQLHQLRGRVGRSHHQAYAYLLIPEEKKITNDAKKRLDALASLEDLGAGFMLATHDLEIRGAGEILGQEQSGHMQAIGFSLYMELLERAVQSLKDGIEPDIENTLQQETEVELRIPALIPENYLPDVHSRLILYKRISNAKDVATLDELQVEMIDRFGLLPPQAKNIFQITELKLKAQRLGIRKLEGNLTGGLITFNDKPNVDSTHLIHLIQTKPKQFKLDGPNRLRFYLSEDNKENLPEKIASVLNVVAS
jgi:transcription-repair coupling factor (superfamily II helicase)